MPAGSVFAGRYRIVRLSQGVSRVRRAARRPLDTGKKSRRGITLRAMRGLVGLMRVLVARDISAGK